MEFAAEATYPVSGTYTAGIMVTSSQIASIVVNLIVGVLIDNSSITVAQIPGLSVSFIAFVITLFIKEDLRRLKDDININNDDEDLVRDPLLDDSPQSPRPNGLDKENMLRSLKVLLEHEQVT